MRKSFRQILLAALVLTFICGTAFANNSSNMNIQLSIDMGVKGNVFWEQRVIEAMGIGVAPDGITNPAQKQALARRAAVLDAQRNLLEQIQGVQIDSATTVELLALKNDYIGSRVSGMVKGAQVVNNLYQADGSYVVVMQMPLYGNTGLSAVVFDSLKPVQVQPFPNPAPGYKPVEVYTGLVIAVAPNMGLRGAFSPRVYDENNNIIYGDKFIDPNFAISQGMVDYSSLGIARSGNSRAGAKPLIINALRVTDHGFNVVISNADAQKVLAAQAQNGFMKECKVVFAKN